MAETALKKSRDVNELKNFRGGAPKGQVMSAVNKLVAIFARKVEDDFDHQNIFISEVNQVEAKLKDKLDLFLRLNERCCEFREEGADADQEIKLVITMMNILRRLLVKSTHCSDKLKLTTEVSLDLN